VAPLASHPRRGADLAGRGRGTAIALGVLCTILFLTFLDNTVVSVALGSVQTELGAGVSALQWVVSAYALTFAGAMLAFGMIGDQFGRKRVMLAGVVIFCAGSVLAAFARDTGVLITGRAVMGLGAAASEPGTLSMLRHLYDDERSRARALGVWTAVSGLALAAGPVIGGALVGLWNWRGIFWFNVAFGLAALVAGWLVLPESADPDPRRVDVTGAILGAAALTALTFGIIDAESDGFTAAGVLLLLCVAALAAAAFFWRESRAVHPLLDLRFLRVPRFGTAIVVAFCAYFATFAVFFFTALYLQEVVGYDGYKIALVFLPMAVLMIAASLAAGRWTAAAGPGWSILAGCVLFGGGLLATAFTLSADPPVLPLAAALALTGVGIGATVVPITSDALSAVPAARSGMAASATNTSREIGAVTGVAILGALVNSRLRSSLTGRLRHLGIPANFQSIVIHAIETGGVPSSGHSQGAGGAAGAGHGSLVQEVIQAAYTAFYTGLRAALILSAILVLVSGAGSFVLLRRRGQADPTAPGPAAPGPAAPGPAGADPGRALTGL
jgi:EmrB/QacA subfamily drug resistance transporter